MNLQKKVLKNYKTIIHMRMIMNRICINPQKNNKKPINKVQKNLLLKKNILQEIKRKVLLRLKIYLISKEKKHYQKKKKDKLK